MENFSEIAMLLTKLTSKKVVFKWDSEFQNSYHCLTQKIITSPIVAFPDSKGTFVLDVDASADTLRGVLSQIQEGKGGVIAQSNVKSRSTKLLHD